MQRSRYRCLACKNHSEIRLGAVQAVWVHPQFEQEAACLPGTECFITLCCLTLWSDSDSFLSEFWGFNLLQNEGGVSATRMGREGGGGESGEELLKEVALSFHSDCPITWHRFGCGYHGLRKKALKRSSTNQSAIMKFFHYSKLHQITGTSGHGLGCVARYIT